jgi:hypothetical protein
MWCGHDSKRSPNSAAGAEVSRLRSRGRCEDRQIREERAMASDDDNEQMGIDQPGGGRGPVWAAAAFAVGAGAALGGKALLDRRRRSRSQAEVDSNADASNEDLPTVLRRAALDVALAATTKAAQRLDTDNGQERSASESALERS